MGWSCKVWGHFLCALPSELERCWIPWCCLLTMQRRVLAQAQQFAVAEMLHADWTFLVPIQLRGKAGLNSELLNLGLYPEALQTILVTELWSLANCQPEMFQAEWINLQALTENAIGILKNHSLFLSWVPKNWRISKLFVPLEKAFSLVSAS